MTHTLDQISRLQRVADDRNTMLSYDELLARLEESKAPADDFLAFSEFQVEIADKVDALFRQLTPDSEYRRPGDFIVTVGGLLGASLACFTYERPVPNPGLLLAAVQGLTKAFSLQFLQGAKVDDMPTNETPTEGVVK